MLMIEHNLPIESEVAAESSKRKQAVGNQAKVQAKKQYRSVVIFEMGLKL